MANSYLSSTKKNQLMKAIITSLFCLFSSFYGFSQLTETQKLMEQDWANLKKYKLDNEIILADARKIPVVFMGNSITEGWIDHDPDFFSENNYINRGIGGQTTPQMLIRFMPDVVDLKPEIVVILAGTNDIAGNTGASSFKMITNNIKAMAQLAAANNIKVILSSVLPVYDYPWRPGLQPIEKIEKINRWLEEFASANDHSYLDYYSAMVNDEKGLRADLSEDGVHPNSKGYEMMKILVKNALEKAGQ